MPSDEDVLAFTDSLDVVLKKRNIEPKNCEELTLAIDGLNLVSGFPVLLAVFNAEIERKKKLERQ